jgi:hypothetical protein
MVVTFKETAVQVIQIKDPVEHDDYELHRIRRDFPNFAQLRPQLRYTEKS